MLLSESFLKWELNAVKLSVWWVLSSKKDIYASTSRPRKHSRRGSESIVELRDGKEHSYALSSEWNVTLQLETQSTKGYEDKTCTNSKQEWVWGLVGKKRVHVHEGGYKIIMVKIWLQFTVVTYEPVKNIRIIYVLQRSFEYRVILCINSSWWDFILSASPKL